MQPTRAYDAHRAAGWSQAISVGLLRQTLGFTGISITDSLTGTAAARGLSAAALAIRAAQAGTDMILVSGTESTTPRDVCRAPRRRAGWADRPRPVGRLLRPHPGDQGADHATAR